MKTKLIKHHLGILESQVWLFVGAHSEKNLYHLFKQLGCKKKWDDICLNEWDRCFGICYGFARGALIWIHPDNRVEQLYDTVPHEVSHAVDDIMDTYGYKDVELRAKLQGLLTYHFLKDLGLIVKTKK